MTTTMTTFADCPALAACMRGDWRESERLLLARGDPADPRVRFNLGWHALRHGDLQRGIELLDAGRWVGLFGSAPLGAGTPIYDGVSAVHGRTVLLHSEGGLGDQIAHARFATPLARNGARVMLSCAAELRVLLSRVEGVHAVVSTAGARHVLHDCWIPSMSAPRVLGYVYGDLPNAAYLHASQRARVRMYRAFGARRGFSIGLRWQGSPVFEHEQHRRFDPRLMIDLARACPRASFYSFQRDAGVEHLRFSDRVTDLSPLLVTWDDTCAALERMDVVITSCTSVAHCAAALGVPTWVIVPIMPYYLWLWPGDDTSVWYGSVRLFRQRHVDDWHSPFAAVEHALQVLVREH